MKERIRSAEAIAWDTALEFQKSCPSQESSSEFVYRLRDMITKAIYDGIKNEDRARMGAILNIPFVCDHCKLSQIGLERTS